MADFTRHELLDALQASQQQVVKLLETMADRQDWQPEPAEWSFRMIAAHLALVERTCHLARLQDIATGTSPHLRLYANTTPDVQHRELRDSLQQWIATRRQLLDFVGGLRDHELHYVGIHARVGPMTVLDILEEILEQDKGNLRHVRQLIVAFYEEQFTPTTVTYEAL